MKIGIDGRLWNETGVGRYIRALVIKLGKIDSRNQYRLFLRKTEMKTVTLPNSRWRKIAAEVSWHTLAEQIKLPDIYRAAGCELIHIPYFSVPLVTPKPFVVTIHDLTISHFATGRASSKPLPLYLLKHWGYRRVLQNAVKSATHIICVSQTVKKQLLAEYGLDPDKVSVTYESGELESGQSTTVVAPADYLLYVGNAHPHKNLERLIQAYVIIKSRYESLKLVLVGQDDYFYPRLRTWVQKKQIPDVVFPGAVANTELRQWYKQAKLFVFPSLSEGFGIPGLEAMICGTPVIAANIPTFREIYRDGAGYFDPDSEANLAEVISKVLTDAGIRQKLIDRGKKRAGFFSWRKMAEQTLEIYENCLRLRPHQ